MTTLPITLTTEESKWLDDWATLSGHGDAEQGIREVLKVCGALPKGSAYWKKQFTFAE